MLLLQNRGGWVSGSSIPWNPPIHGNQYIGFNQVIKLKLNQYCLFYLILGHGMLKSLPTQISRTTSTQWQHVFSMHRGWDCVQLHNRIRLATYWLDVTSLQIIVSPSIMRRESSKYLVQFQNVKAPTHLWTCSPNQNFLRGNIQQVASWKLIFVYIGDKYRMKLKSSPCRLKHFHGFSKAYPWQICAKARQSLNTTSVQVLW